ncbi:hypothetical protein AB0O76_40510 [Streptomyces sp. NPDC086554]|uniref:hypothetical protein n=1 Tax=Streptomyces sp. NPDC086554 TaxID=3154864 RepID=UPI0034256DDF
MGAMKAYETDRAEIREAAIEAAHALTMDGRRAEMEHVWAMCGDAAKHYHHPPAVAAMLVKEAVAAYMDSRTTQITEDAVAA